MTDQPSRKTLRDLAETLPRSPNVTAIVRVRLPDIEAAIARGWGYVQIAEALSEELGLTISPKSLGQALWRIRNPKDGEKKGTKRTPRTVAPETSESLPAEPEATPEDDSGKSPQEKLREAMMAKDRAADMFSSFNQPKRPIGGKIK